MINRAETRPKEAPGGRSSPVALTVSTTDVRALIAAFERLGFSTTDLLAAIALRPSDLDDPDARVSCELYVRLIQHAQRTRPLKNLPTRLAGETPIGAYPLLDYLVVTSESVGAGLTQLSRYFRLVDNPGTIEFLHTPDHVEIVLRNAGGHFFTEYTIALIVFHMRHETGAAFRPLHVAFIEEPDDRVDLERLFQCPVRSGNSNHIVVSHDIWQLPLTRRDPILRSMLERLPDAAAVDGDREDTVVHRVRRALAARVSGGDTRLEVIARDLAVAPRTLQRKLGEAGVTYHDLVESARKQAATRHLDDSKLSVCEIAYLLGYSEPAAFYRAFKRWHGVGPQAFRRGAPERATRA